MKIIKHVCVMLALALGILLIPNLAIFDESVLPEITRLLANSVDHDIEGNAYYSIYGLRAASDKDTEEVGKAVIKTLQSKHEKGAMANLTDAETIALYGGKENGDEAWQALLASGHCNPRLQTGCFEQSLADISAKPSTNERWLVQQQRYLHIIKSPHMIEDMRQLDYTSPLPNFFLIMKIGELNQALAYQTSGLDGLIASCQADMQFWRMVQGDTQTLIGKMVSLVSLHRNLAALSYGIKNTPSLTPEQAQQLQTLLTPLTPAEISMEKQLIAELRFSLENWRTAPKNKPEDQPLLLWLLTQPTASANWFYRQTLKPAFVFNKMSASEFYEQAQNSTKPLAFSRLNPYNLGGKIYQSKNWQYAAYIGRTHDLAGIYSLVALQLALKTNPPDDVASAIKTSPYRNPYTAKPFNYDPINKTMSFSCFDVKDICEISI